MSGRGDESFPGESYQRERMPDNRTSDHKRPNSWRKSDYRYNKNTRRGRNTERNRNYNPSTRGRMPQFRRDPRCQRWESSPTWTQPLLQDGSGTEAAKQRLDRSPSPFSLSEQPATHRDTDVKSEKDRDSGNISSDVEIPSDAVVPYSSTKALGPFNHETETEPYYVRQCRAWVGNVKAMNQQRTASLKCEIMHLKAKCEKVDAENLSLKRYIEKHHDDVEYSREKLEIDSEMHSLERALEAKQNVESALARRVNEQEKTVSELKWTVAELQLADKEQLRKTIAEHQKTVSDLQQKLAARDREKKNLQRNISPLLETIRELKQIVDATEIQKEHLQKSSSQLMNTVSDLQQKLACKELELKTTSELHLTVAKQQKTISDLKQTFALKDRTMNSSKTQHQIIISDIQRTNAKLKKTIHELEQNLDKEKHGNLEKKTSEQKNTICELKQKLEDTNKMKDQLQTTTADLQRTNSELKKMILDLEQKVEKDKLRKLEKKTSEQRKTISEFKQMLESTNTKTDQLQAANADLQRTNAKLNTFIHELEVDKEKLGNLEKKTSELKKSISEMKQKLEFANTEKNHLQTTNAVLQATNSELQRDLEKVVKEGQFAELQHTRQMKESRRKLFKAEEDRDQLRDQLREAQTEHDVHRLYEVARQMEHSERVVHQTLLEKSDSQRQATRDKFRDIYKHELPCSLWCESGPLTASLLGIRIKDEGPKDVGYQDEAQTLTAGTSQYEALLTPEAGSRCVQHLYQEADRPNSVAVSPQDIKPLLTPQKAMTSTSPVIGSLTPIRAETTSDTAPGDSDTPAASISRYQQTLASLQEPGSGLTCVSECLSMSEEKVSRDQAEDSEDEDSLFDGYSSDSDTLEPCELSMKRRRAALAAEAANKKILDNDSKVLVSEGSRKRRHSRNSTPNCGKCRFCLDMRSNGGPGKLRQACVLKQLPKVVSPNKKQKLDGGRS